MGIIAIIALVLLCLYCVWQWKFPPRAIIEMSKGIVSTPPEELAAAAGVDLDTYTLARVAQSEEGLSSDRAKIAVMYATINHCRRQGKSITKVVTAGNPKRSDYKEANGRYGRQGIHPYCTSIADPKPHTIELAISVMDGSAEDETDGAQFWDNPHTQDVLHAANPWSEDNQSGYRSSEEIADRRIADGNELVEIPGVSTRFWK